MKNIKIDDFTKYKYLSNVQFSKDGKYACFMVHNMNVDKNCYESNLWLYDVNKQKYLEITSGNKDGEFLWMDDSENIIFSSNRDKNDKNKKEVSTKYYKINIHGGEAVKVFTIPLNVTSIKAVDDKTYILTAVYDGMKKDSEDDDEKDYEVIDEIPFWSNGTGFVNKKRNRLYIYHSDSGKIEALTDEYTSVGEVKLSDDRKKAVFCCAKYKDKMPLNDEIYIIDIESKKMKKVLKDDDILCCSYIDFIDCDTLIMAASNMQKYGINENHKFYILDMNTEKRTCLTEDKDFSLWDSVGSDCRYGESSTIKKDGKYIYFITTEFDSSFLNRIDKNGNMERICDKNGSIDGYDVKNGNIVSISMWDMKLQELYAFQNNKYTQITHFNDWVIDEYSLSMPKRFDVETAPGVIIEGWIMKPVNFEEGKKYPAILDIHGGPKTVYGEVFFHEMQYWANKGYAVFFCNPRGGDGRGNDFSDIRGKYGTIDYDDIMKFTDEVISKCDFIDEDRLGVTGGSYGGFMTNWIIGHTDRFKAAASQRSIANWISKFCTTDIGYFFVDDQNGATPWNNYEKLWMHSPLKYADKVKTPTLFIHSSEDYRCWIAEGLQMFTALKYHGVDARLCMFKGENHELSRSGKPKHRIRRLKEITDWFDKYLKVK